MQGNIYTEWRLKIGKIRKNSSGAGGRLTGLEAHINT
jgi:hypothetical protein